MKKRGHEVIPSARRLVGSLRDMGYEFTTAVADLVDNSIEAKATVINIDVEFDGDDSWVRIADNGIGMTEAQLHEAMRYGAEREYDETDLGKFGLGLKVASLSQCRRLTIASCTKNSEIAAFSWDYEHIQQTDRWEILPLEGNDLKAILKKPLKKSCGTVVLWERLDRVLGFKQPYGEYARKKLASMTADLDQHLGMVFHRFLAGEIENRNLKITLNGNVVEPWDPFARDEEGTKRLRSRIFEVEHEDVVGKVRMEPYVLPAEKNFSTPAAFRRASGPSKWNQQQGFYIYRANRLIQSGGWSKTRVVDEHTKYARIAISFSPALDDAFKINVAKMKVQLPAQLRDEINTAIKPVLKIAQETYRNANGKQKESSPPTFPITPIPPPEEPPKNTATIQGKAHHGQNAPVANTRYWQLEDLQEKLEELANVDERAIVKKLFARLKKSLQTT